MSSFAKTIFNTIIGNFTWQLASTIGSCTGYDRDDSQYDDNVQSWTAGLLKPDCEEPQYEAPDLDLLPPAQYCPLSQKSAYEPAREQVQTMQRMLSDKQWLLTERDIQPADFRQSHRHEDVGKRTSIAAIVQIFITLHESCEKLDCTLVSLDVDTADDEMRRLRYTLGRIYSFAHVNDEINTRRQRNAACHQYGQPRPLQEITEDQVNWNQPYSARRHWEVMGRAHPELQKVLDRLEQWLVKNKEMQVTMSRLEIEMEETRAEREEWQNRPLYEWEKPAEDVVEVPAVEAWVFS